MYDIMILDGDKGMRRIFAYTETFDKKWGILGLTDDDLNELEKYLLENPQAGAVIQGTGGLRKLRFSLQTNNKGKSGGVRVLYIDFISYDKLYLVDVYGKNEKEDITPDEKKEFKKMIKIIMEKEL